MFSDESMTEQAGIVLGCRDFAKTFQFFTDDLGFRVESIYPADGPTHATLVGFGCRLHLEPGNEIDATLRLAVEKNHPLIGQTSTAPNGISIQYVAAQSDLSIVPLVSSLVVDHEASEGTWHVGRAGMLYRDLVPDRQGGAVIASHIRIPVGGPVPDYVHFHEVLFQLIFCRSGWARLVYEDQGEPFLLNAGDCVIQPPTIRHRVLESGDNLEVIEVGYPAEHVTKADPITTLPTPVVNADRVWNSQTFVRHIADTAVWSELSPGIEITDTGILRATQGMTNVSVIRSKTRGTWSHGPIKESVFELLFVLSGSADIASSHDGEHHLPSGSSIVLPPGNRYEVTHLEASEILKLSLKTVD